MKSEIPKELLSHILASAAMRGGPFASMLGAEPILVMMGGSDLDLNDASGLANELSVALYPEDHDRLPLGLQIIAAHASAVYLTEKLHAAHESYAAQMQKAANTLETDILQNGKGKTDKHTRGQRATFLSADEVVADFNETVAQQNAAVDLLAKLASEDLRKTLGLELPEKAVALTDTSDQNGVLMKAYEAGLIAAREEEAERLASEARETASETKGQEVEESAADYDEQVRTAGETAYTSTLAEARKRFGLPEAEAVREEVKA